MNHAPTLARPLTLGALLLLLAPAHALRAQTAAASATSVAPAARSAVIQAEIATRVPVTIALVDETPGAGGPAVILRRTDQQPADVILLRRRDASGVLLASAITTLLVARDIQGDTALVSSMMRVGTTATANQLSQNELNRATAIIGRLLQKAPTDLPGVGEVPATQVYLRPHALRGKVHRKQQ